MEEKIIAQLQKIKKVLTENSLSVERLEEFRGEVKLMVDEAIRGVADRRNIADELRAKREQLQQWRISIARTFFPIKWNYLLSMPFIYGMALPLVIFHLALECYHQICFRIYDIPRVQGKDYFMNDRQRLPYLNWFEKLNCIYCSYYSNLMQYATEIGARTERYWCPIKYARRTEHMHSQYPHFVDYMDGEHYRAKAKALRDFSDLTLQENKSCDFGGHEHHSS